MTAFLTGAALLTAAALLFILPALLRGGAASAGRARHEEVNLAVLRDQSRELDADLAAGTIDQAAWHDARAELERRVLEDVQPGAAVGTTPRQRGVAIAIGLALPALAAALYFQLGSPAGLEPAAATAAGQQGHEVTDAQIAAMVDGLAERLKNEPGVAEDWSMLARSYAALGRYGEASAAYAKLVELVPGDAGVLADYADTLAMAQDKSLQGEPERLVARALEADPANVKALALSGSAAFERGEYALASERWQKILALVPAGSDIARSTAGSIAEARERAAAGGMALPAAAAAQPEAAAAPAAAAGASLGGTVDIDPALRARVGPDTIVYVFARAAQGPRFPLAVLRKQVKDLPLKFTLDDSMSMTPEARLSAFPQVVVGARISPSGSATPAPGDFEGVSAAVGPAAQGVQVRIDTERK